MTQPTAQDWSDYLEFAQHLAREAGKITLAHFRTRLDVIEKSDRSPVTIADRETEQFLRRAIAARFPGDGLLGEEFGEERPGADFRWILDPIDGTQPFIRGVPLYTVLIALEHEGEARLGVIHNPPLDETAAAAPGTPCLWNGQPCRVTENPALGEAWLNCTDWASMARRHPRATAELLGGARAANTWADAYGYLMVATGRMSAMIDPEMSLWDAAALKPIIEAAGGRFTDLQGRATIDGGSALAANPRLHEQILQIVMKTT